MRQKILILILLFIILTGMPTALTISATVTILENTTNATVLGQNTTNATVLGQNTTNATVLGQNTTVQNVQPSGENTEVQNLQPYGENNSSLNKKVVLGYYSIFAESDWENIRFDNLSTLALYNIAPTSNGSLREDYDSVISDHIDQLIIKAHNNGVKVIFSFGPPVGEAEIIDSLLGNASAKNNTLNNILGFIQKHNFDGVDVDIEGINPTNSITGTSNKVLMTNFIKDLRTKLNTVNSNYSIYLVIGSYYQHEDEVLDIGNIQNYVDYIMMIGYDYYIGPIAGSNAPIDSHNEDPSIRDSVGHYSGLMNKSKLLLGVGWFGYERTTQTGNLSSVATDDGIPYGYQDMKEGAAQYGRIWDNTWKTPWYKYQVNDTWYQGHYDDIESLSIKYDLVISQNLAGIGIWQLEYGDKVPELWQLINEKFGK